MATAQSPSDEETVLLGEQHDLRLSVVRRPARDVGSVILQPESSQLIADVGIEVATIRPDDRGYFSELFRLGSTPLTADLVGCLTLQVSMAVSYPGTIKAWHYHFEQTDFWAVAQGMLQVALCDLREKSPTHGMVNTLYVGVLRPWRLKIPCGVAHGYKVVGLDSATLVYLTDRFYNPRDEGRLPYDHPYLNYDWELQHK